MTFRDILLALTVILIWAGNVIAIKLAVEEIAPLTALAIRFGLTALVFLPFARWPGKQAFFTLFQIALLMGLLHQGLLFLGMNYLPAGTTSILLQSQVIFSALIGWLVFKEVIRWRTWTGIALGVAGLVLMFGIDNEDGHVIGFWLLLASTFTLAFAYMRMKQLAPVKPATFLFAINGLAVPFVLAASLVADAPSWTMLDQANWLILGGVFAFQIFLVGLSHILWQGLLSRNPMSLVIPFTLLLPVFGVALAVLLLGEDLTLRMLGGGALTMAGVGIIIMRNAQKSKSLPRTPASSA